MKHTQFSGNSHRTSNRSFHALLMLALGFMAMQARAQGVDPKCEKLLPTKSVVAVLGAGIEPGLTTGSQAGETDCYWHRQSLSVSLKLHNETAAINHQSPTFSLQQYDQTGLDNMRKVYGPSIADQLWERRVAIDEGAGDKRQMLSGLGKRTSLVRIPNHYVNIRVLREHDYIQFQCSSEVSSADWIRFAKGALSKR